MLSSAPLPLHHSSISRHLQSHPPESVKPFRSFPLGIWDPNRHYSATCALNKTRWSTETEAVASQVKQPLGPNPSRRTQTTLLDGSRSATSGPLRLTRPPGTMLICVIGNSEAPAVSPLFPSLQATSPPCAELPPLLDLIRAQYSRFPHW